MFGLVMLAFMMAVGAISLIAGVDSRDGFVDDRKPPAPIGLS